MGRMQITMRPSLKRHRIPSPEAYWCQDVIESELIHTHAGRPDDRSSCLLDQKHLTNGNQIIVASISDLFTFISDFIQTTHECSGVTPKMCLVFTLEESCCPLFCCCSPVLLSSVFHSVPLKIDHAMQLTRSLEKRDNPEIHHTLMVA